MLATYAAKYRSLKAPRKLVWRPNLGTVALDLAIGDQTLEFNVRRGAGVGVGCCVPLPLPLPCTDSTRALPPPSTLPAQVSPFHAAVLMHFQSRPEWPTAELAETMGVAPDALRRRAIFWVNQGAYAGAGCRGCRLDCYMQRRLPAPGLHQALTPAPPPCRPTTAGVLSESRVAGPQGVPHLVYRRNEQLQSGAAVPAEQEAMEQDVGGAAQHEVRP